MIVGKVGSGKSSLLNALLGQLFHIPDSLYDTSKQFECQEEVDQFKDSLYRLPAVKSDSEYACQAFGQVVLVEQ